MGQATISQLKNRLSAYLARVIAGETILVLDRDRPIARLEPLPPDGEPSAALAELERAGLIRRGAGRPPIEMLRTRPPRSSPGSAVDALIADRREGR